MCGDERTSFDRDDTDPAPQADDFSLHARKRSWTEVWQWPPCRPVRPPCALSHGRGLRIESDDIVKGIKQKGGDYVVLSDAQIKTAFPKSTQTIEIETFVNVAEINFVLMERP